MKKPYIKPEVYSEDISIAFVGTCCVVWEGVTAFALTWCAGNCHSLPDPGGYGPAGA